MELLARTNHRDGKLSQTAPGAADSGAAKTGSDAGKNCIEPRTGRCSWRISRAGVLDFALRRRCDYSRIESAGHSTCELFHVSAANRFVAALFPARRKIVSRGASPAFRIASFQHDSCELLGRDETAVDDDLARRRCLGNDFSVIRCVDLRDSVACVAPRDADGDESFRSGAVATISRTLDVNSGPQKQDH